MYDDIAFSYLSFLFSYQLNPKEGKATRSAQILDSLYSRFLRIFPALFLAIVLYTLAELIRSSWNQEHFPKGYWSNVLNTIFYLSDIEPFGLRPANPWKNTWTVAVIEKWYIVWVIFLPTIITSRFKKYITYVLLAFCSVLMALNLLVYSSIMQILFFGWDGFLGQGWKWLFGALIPFVTLPGWMQNKKSFSVGLCLTISLALFDQLLQIPNLLSIEQNIPFLQYKFINELFSPFAAILMLLGSSQGNYILETKFMRFFRSGFIFLVSNASSNMCIQWMA